MDSQTWLSEKILLLILTVSMAFLPACTLLEQQSTLPIIKIGLVAPFEGLHRPLGYEVLFGVKLALQERNLGPGLHGYRVELVALNDFDDPVEAQIQAKALVTDPDVLGVVGHLSTATTLAAMPVYQQANLAMSVPWTIAAAEPSSHRKGVVTVAASEAETLTELSAVKRKMGIQHVLEVTGSRLSNVPVQAQAVQLSGDAVAAGELILSLQQAGIDLPVLGQVEVGSPQLLQVAGKATNGLIFVSPGPGARHAADAETFIKKYTDLAGFSPGPRAVLAYDATNVLLDAIASVISAGGQHPPGRSAISGVIAEVQHHGLSGDIVFDTQGQRVNAPVWVYRIVKEQYPGALVAP